MVLRTSRPSRRPLFFRDIVFCWESCQQTGNRLDAGTRRLNKDTYCPERACNLAQGCIRLFLLFVDDIVADFNLELRLSLFTKDQLDVYSPKNCTRLTLEHHPKGQTLAKHRDWEAVSSTLLHPSLAHLPLPLTMEQGAQSLVVVEPLLNSLESARHCCRSASARLS